MTETSQTLSTIFTPWAEDAPTSSAQREPQLELLPELPQTAPKPACAAIGQINPRELNQQIHREHHEQIVMAGI